MKNKIRTLSDVPNCNTKDNTSIPSNLKKKDTKDLDIDKIVDEHNNEPLKQITGENISQKEDNNTYLIRYANVNHLAE